MRKHHPLHDAVQAAAGLHHGAAGVLRQAALPSGAQLLAADVQTLQVAQLGGSYQLVWVCGGGQGRMRRGCAQGRQAEGEGA
jgi:hypothetical protein